MVPAVEPKWTEWINKTYIEWRGNTRVSVTDFAMYLEVSQSTVSAWINGTRGHRSRRGSLPRVESFVT